MPVVLFLISLVSHFLSFARHSSGGVRQAFLKASVLHGLIVCVSTECCSIWRAFTLPSLVSIWTLSSAIGCSLVLHDLARSHSATGIYDFKPFPLRRKAFICDSWVVAFSLLVIGIILLVNLITALMAAPNSFDSLTYHMPRVMHWIQNQNVGHYPAHNLRHISFSPGAEYIVAHLQILSGNDRLANLVQWWGYLGSVVAVSMIAGVHGRGRCEVLAALVAATVPMAIMQSTTTQTDLIESFWLLCFASFALSGRDGIPSVSLCFWRAASLGMAVLTKPTGIIFGFPLVAIMVYLDWKKSSSQEGRQATRVIFRSIAMVTVSAMLALPWALRNKTTFGTFMGVDTGTRVSGGGLLVSGLSNSLRSIVLNVPSSAAWRFVGELHTLLGLDPNAPESTYEKSHYEESVWKRVLVPDEDAVGSPVHALVLLFSAAYIASIWRSRDEHSAKSGVLALGAVLVTQFLLGNLLLKWQEEANRLFLPVTLMAAPLGGMALGHPAFRKIGALVLVAMGLSGFAYSLVPMHHPLIALPSSLTNISQSGSILRMTREERYFGSWGGRATQTYQNVTRSIVEEHCGNLGLDLRDDTWEYPIWVLLAQRGWAGRIKHVNVRNESRARVPEFSDGELDCAFCEEGASLTYYGRSSRK